MTRVRKPEALTAQEAASLLNAHVETVRRLARRGEIPSFKLGKDWRFQEEALLIWAQAASARTPAVPQTAVGGPPANLRDNENGSFPIVGIGASAGGLEALESFFRHTPEGSGFAFVVVQHLDPNHKGMLVELLQRATTMRVRQVSDRLRVEPDEVYVIPPNKDLSILHGVLHLLAPAAPRGQRLPIDFFFRSLAIDCQARSFGVILSGMGSDGTLGLGDIKEQGGTTFVQTPTSAKFDSMPRSAVEAGLADVVAPVEELAGRIVAHRTGTPLPAPTRTALASTTQSAIEKICILLRNQTGHDFSLYKRSTIYRRIERRLSLHKIGGIAAYLQYLQESPQEITLLFKELLIGVTSFFRDPPVWEFLQTAAIPALLAERAAGGMLRAWVPACSTGEEAYSLAITFKEVLANMRPEANFSLQIFATDLDQDAIVRARQGVYPPSIAGDVSAPRLSRFFTKTDPKTDQGYRVNQEIREMVVFATQNIIMDPPFTRLDILSCRNLLIYMAPELQNKLLPLFHYSLNPGGILCLGSAETLGAAAAMFAPLSAKTRIYRRLDASMRAEMLEFPASFSLHSPATAGVVTAKTAAPNLQTLADRLLLTRFAPAAVVTNDQGDILYVSGRTGKYLEPAAGKANWNLHAMAREGLRLQLGACFRKALRAHGGIAQTRLTLADHGTTQEVEISVEPLLEPDALRGMLLVIFTDVPAPLAAQAPNRTRRTSAATKLEQELEQARDELQTTREEMQTSQEELKSANEELQSTNEELQSMNEELTTSKEEMQSMNEELQILNHEQQAKVEELSHVNDDMRNLLDSTDIATLFLDGDLRVRRFTAQMTKIIKLIPSDINRPFTDLASDMVYPKLAADAREVLQSLVFRETQVATTDGRWYSVRIMPYRTLDNRIAGVVITFVDITAAKLLEATLRENQVSQEDRE